MQKSSTIRIKAQKAGVVSTVVSWFNSLFSRFRWAGTWFGTREVVADVSATEAVEKGFSGNAAVYAIVQRDAKKFAGIPRYVVDAKSLEKRRKHLPAQFKDYGKTTRLNNKLADLIARPNPYQGQTAFFRTVRAYYRTCGEGMIWLNRGDTEGKTDLQIDLMPVLEMYPLPSYRMEAVPDPDNLWGITGWILNVNGQQLPIRKNDVIHWKDTNLRWDATTREHLRGMPALRPGAASLQQNNDATLGSVRMIQNDGAKGALFSKTLGTAPQESQVRSVIDRKINNNDLKGAVATLQGEWGYVDLGKSSIDLDLLNAKDKSMMELCFLFGVPYTLFDPNTAFANSEWQQKNWITNEIIPASKELDDELNRQLLKAFALEGRAVIICDYSELPELQEDLAKMTTWLKDAYWITPDEKREMQGYEPYGEPFDEPWMPTNLTPLSHMEDPLTDIAAQMGLSDYAVPAPAKPDPKLNGAAAKTS